MNAIAAAWHAIPFSLDRPWWLVALAVVPWVWWVAITSRRTPTRSTGTRAKPTLVGLSRRGSSWVVHAALRTVVVTCLVLALAGLVVPAPVAGVATIFVIDRSASIPADVQAAAAGYATTALAARGPDDLGAVVSFGRTARIDAPVRRRDVTAQATPDVTATLDGTDRDATDLAQAITPPPPRGHCRRFRCRPRG